MSANVPTPSIIKPPQIFLSKKHRVFEPARLLMAGQSLSRKILAAGLLEGINRRTVGADLPELLGSIYCEFFCQKIEQRQGKQANRSRCPNAKCKRNCHS